MCWRISSLIAVRGIFGCGALIRRVHSPLNPLLIAVEFDAKSFSLQRHLATWHPVESFFLPVECLIG